MSFSFQIEKNLVNCKEAFADVMLFKVFEKKAAAYFAQVLWQPCFEFYFVNKITLKAVVISKNTPYGNFAR